MLGLLIIINYRPLLLKSTRSLLGHTLTPTPNPHLGWRSIDPVGYLDPMDSTFLEEEVHRIRRATRLPAISGG
jgi:hypothetical protein